MRLAEVSLRDGLEEVVTWGIRPMKELVKIMDQELDRGDGPDTDTLLFTMYELRHKLEDIEETLYRFEGERREQMGKV